MISNDFRQKNLYGGENAVKDMNQNLSGVVVFKCELIVLCDIVVYAQAIFVAHKSRNC